MDGYPKEYTGDVNPYIVLYGLDLPGKELQRTKTSQFLQRNGVKVVCEAPCIKQNIAQKLFDAFSKAARNADSVQNGRVVANEINVKACGRNFVFPCRKASPQASTQEFQDDVQSPTTPSSSGTVLHSPLSPLSHGSPLYPDGVMTPVWIEKHNEAVPAGLFSFFTVSSDTNMNTLNDNKLKTEISSVKSSLDSSRFRTRHFVILIGEDISPLEATDVRERVSTVARSSRLELNKSLFYLDPNATDDDIREFTELVVKSTTPQLIEYYKDLERHSRRKKDRGNVSNLASPTSPVAQTLSKFGWTARYEFKLAIFAEFRGDLDLAERHYSAANRALTSHDGVFDTISSWSPRWNETRQLSDIVILRQVRCLLLRKSPTTAVRLMRSHRERMRDILERKSKGTKTYAWGAWLARMAKSMAELLHRTNIPLVKSKSADAQETLILEPGRPYLAVEKFLQPEPQLIPWDYLHHPGYWHALAAVLTMERRAAATQIPEEDRAPPNASPAALVARRNEIYDSYLCPEPHSEYKQALAKDGAHVTEIIASLDAAAQQFSLHEQMRMADHRRLDLCIHLADAAKFDQALQLLLPMWKDNRWRKERWWSLVGQLTYQLFVCARAVEDTKMQIAALWELSSHVYKEFQDISYDFYATVKTSETDDGGTKGSDGVINLTNKEIRSFCTIGLTFEDVEGHVGDLVNAQVVLKSAAHATAKALTFSRLSIAFSGPINTLVVNHVPTHDSTSPPQHTVSISRVALTDATEAEHRNAESGSTFRGDADLTLRPQHITVLNIQIVLKEAGTLIAKKATAEAQIGSFTVEYDHFLSASPLQPVWWHTTTGGEPQGTPISGDTRHIKILPKQPKLRINTPDLRGVYYTGEEADIEIYVTNAEADEVNVEIQLQILRGEDEMPQMKWKNEPNEENLEDSTLEAAGLLTHKLGVMEIGAEQQRSVNAHFGANPAEITIEIRALYSLKSDPEVLVKKTVTMEVQIIKPFDTNFAILSVWHPEPWPSFFSTENIHEQRGNDEEERSDEKVREADVDGVSKGLEHRWLLDANLKSMAAEQLRIVNVELEVTRVFGGSLKLMRQFLGEDDNEDENKDGKLISPNETVKAGFELDSQTRSLDDPQTISGHVRLHLEWQRLADSTRTSKISLNVPALSLQSIEPRILAVQQASKNARSLVIDYVLENPSMHFLTFAVGMEQSEDFAFSGPNATTINLLPYSRHHVRYCLFPLVSGSVIQPKLKVKDVHFNKILRIIPTASLKGEDGSVSIWIPEQVHNK